jgi:hypothetical protein
MYSSSKFPLSASATARQPTRPNPHGTWLAVLAGLISIGLPRVASADTGGIKHPGQHIDYFFELEPEVILVFSRPLDEGPGVGVRGSIPLLFNGFVSSINNSVAITFGIDKDPLTKGHTFYVPIAMQWNFWLSRNVSVFGEPGVLLQFADKTRPYPQVWGGARLHFTDSVALTARLSLPDTPAMSFGVSFFF